MRSHLNFNEYPLQWSIYPSIHPLLAIVTHYYFLKFFVSVSFSFILVTTKYDLKIEDVPFETDQEENKDPTSIDATVLLL